MNLTNERPVPFTNTSKPSTAGDLLPSWLVIVIFHTKLSPGRRARSASRTMSPASSASAGRAKASRIAPTIASLDMSESLHDVEAGGAPSGVERGQRGGDDREAERLGQHLGHDEDLHREPAGGTRRRRQLDPEGGDDLGERHAEHHAGDAAQDAEGDAFEHEHGDDTAPA